jgi:hypothetical protein
MAKPDLGQKRICVCPKCGTEQPIEQPKVRRGGNVAELRKPKKAAVIEDADPDVEVEAADEEAEEGVLEDTSDLDDDADAISEELEVDPDREEPET